MKMKTSELNDAALDYAVGKAEGLSHWLHGRVLYSNDWSEGGPIIERERITIDAGEHGRLWAARKGVYETVGPTPLVAAMRCYVVSKFGDQVELPEGLADAPC
jgi:hypothetical protein